MTTSARRKMPPLWIFIIVFVTIYTAVSIGITVLFGFPWHVPMPIALVFGAGLPFLVLGLVLLVWSIRSLSMRRAMGKELFLDKSESKLITHGPYAYTRNPIYLAVLICLLGWFFLLRLTPLGFLVVIFGFHFFAVAKWEERELRQRFGPEYDEYRKRVPLFVPRLIRYKQQ
ncbi:MAG TPA: isoprenylcysteine carboxylmethyltransferase family protein [Thermoguttaceae bacterium]